MRDATFRPVGPADELQPGTVNPYYLEDRRQRIAIARVGDELYAFDDLHAGGSLSAGLLEGRTVMSQRDGTRFDVATGAALDGPSTASLGVYPVRVTDGQLEVQL